MEESATLKDQKINPWKPEMAIMKILKKLVEHHQRSILKHMFFWGNICRYIYIYIYLHCERTIICMLYSKYVCVCWWLWWLCRYRQRLLLGLWTRDSGKEGNCMMTWVLKLIQMIRCKKNKCIKRICSKVSIYSIYEYICLSTRVKKHTCTSIWHMQ